MSSSSVIHRKRILQQRGHNYSRISDNNPIQSPLDSLRKQKKSGNAHPRIPFNTFQRLMKSMTRYICRAISTSPCPLVIIIGWQSSILIRDFTSWPLELLGRTRKQSRWNVKIDTGREVATRIETAYIRRLILLRYNRDFTRRSFDTARTYLLIYSCQHGSNNPAKINPFRKLPIEIMERLTTPPTFGFVYV